MRALMLLLMSIALAVPAVAATVSLGPEACPAPADLAFDAGVVHWPVEEGVPADLPGPRYALPKSFTFPLSLRLPPPAPRGTELPLGTVVIDGESGAVTIDGVVFAPQGDCLTER